MYVDSNYLDYKYIVSYSDNYAILSRSRSVHGTWDNPVEVDTYVQYFTPSTYGYESSSTFTTTRVFPEVEVTDDFYARADCPTIMLSIYSSIFFILFIINGLTKFVKKGGLFFGQ